MALASTPGTTMRSGLVELIGPAGAGKSTLVDALLERDARFARGLNVWGLPRRDLVRSAVELGPTLASATLARRPLQPRELAQMIRLGALRLAVDRLAVDADRVHLIDEGPIFALTWLDVFFARGDAWYLRWRRHTVQEWGRRLIAVIRLDADDQILVRRIRTRVQPHPVKHDPDHEIVGFTARYRCAFDRVLMELRTVGPVSIVDLRTDEPHGTETVAYAHGVLEETLHGR